MSVMKQYEDFSNRQIATIVMSVAALGFWGWLIWKFGILDALVSLTIQILMLFPMFLVMLYIINDSTYQHVNETLTKCWHKTVGRVFGRKQPQTHTEYIDDDDDDEMPLYRDN